MFINVKKKKKKGLQSYEFISMRPCCLENPYICFLWKEMWLQQQTANENVVCYSILPPGGITETFLFHILI